MTIRRETLFAAATAIGLVLAGTACSGESDTSARTTETSQPQQDAGPEAPASRQPGARLATAKFRVQGMTCGGCAMATEMAVEKLEGVESVDAEYLGEGKSGRCTVTYDPSVLDTEQIASAIESAGYDPDLASTSSGS